MIPWIDKSIPDFEFWVGDSNFAPYLLSLSISQGISDMRSPLLWRGDFELAYTFNCPLDEDEFSEFDTPSRWRSGLSQVRFIVRGYPVATMRISNYRYLNGRGKGELVQILELAEFDRPAQEIPEVKVANETKISRCVELLLNKAVAEMPEPPAIAIGEWESRETYDNYLTTQKPVSEAQSLTGLYWRWVWVDHEERVRLIHRPEKPQRPLFQRSLKEVNLSPHTEAIHFAAEKVIISGARETAVPYDEYEKGNPNCSDTTDRSHLQEPTAEQKTGLDDKNRPRKTVTETAKARGLVFPPIPDSQGVTPPPDLSIMIAERRTIHTLHGDSFDVPIDVSLPLDILNTYYGGRKVTGTRSEAIASISITEVPLGTLIDNPYAPSTEEILEVSEVQIEAEHFRISYKTKLALGLEPLYFGDSAATFQPNYVAALTLFLERYESVKSGLSLPYTRISISGAIDPETGQPQRNECDRKAEGRRKAPSHKVVTKTFKGVCKLKPNGYDPFQPRTYREDVGYLPSQVVATNLAKQIGYREIARRDGMLVEMPLPVEWLQAGCPPFSVVHIDKHCLLIDEPIIALEQGELRFGFTGERLGKIRRVPSPRTPIPWLPSGGLEIAPLPTIQSLAGVAIAPIPLQAYGGTPPYTFTGTLPDGLSIVDGAIVGAITSPVDESESYTLTVTDADGSAVGAIAFAVESVPSVQLPAMEELTFEIGLTVGVELLVVAIGLPYELDGLVLGIEFSMSDPPTPSEITVEAGLVLGIDLLMPGGD